MEPNASWPAGFRSADDAAGCRGRGAKEQARSAETDGQEGRQEDVGEEGCKEVCQKVCEGREEVEPEEIRVEEIEEDGKIKERKEDYGNEADQEVPAVASSCSSA